jgi:hypothetical protein
MKSVPLPSGATLYAHEHNALRSDACAASFLLAHQQLGALALPTNPTDGQAVTLVVNGTNIVLTGRTGAVSLPGDFKIQGTAALTAAVIEAGLLNPTVTTSTFIALGAANAQLVQYLGWGYPAGSTTITPYSLNSSSYSPLATLSASTTVTGGSWTGQTMKLYVEPGTYYIGATRVLFLGGSTPTFTAPVSNPRIDIVTADSSGVIGITQGSESATPAAPAYPTNKVVICEVYNVVAETALYDNANQQTNQGYVLNDVRMILQPVYIGSATQVAAQLFIPWIPSVAQGDIAYFDGAAWVRLPAGFSGSYLQTQGAGANPQWNQFNVPEIAGTDTGPTIAASSPASPVTHTITHGLGKRPQFITATISNLQAIPPSGSGATNNNGYGWIFLDTNGVARGGLSFIQNVGTSNLTSVGVGPTSVTASATSSGGSGSCSITINNVTATTFDIVYSYSITSGTASFTFVNVGWMVFG